MMNCKHCGGTMEDGAAICPHCRLRQSLDERPLSCPQCATPLAVLGAVRTRVNACASCRGIFYNPADFRGLLEDPANAEPGGRPLPEAVAISKVYRQCPVCTQAMSPVNLRGSRAVLDCCPGHGIWLDAGELTTLRQWWLSEGRKNPAVLNRVAVQLTRQTGAAAVAPAVMAADAEKGWGNQSGGFELPEVLGDVVGAVLEILSVIW